jgi:hypothetical protein
MNCNKNTAPIGKKNSFFDMAQSKRESKFKSDAHDDLDVAEEDLEDEEPMKEDEWEAAVAPDDA